MGKRQAVTATPSKTVWATSKSDDGKKTRAKPEELRQKVKKCVGYLCHKGGLQQELIYKAVKHKLEAISPKDALHIMYELGEKGGAVRNPTAWVKAYAEKVGPEPDIKIRKTISWYNQHGGLKEEIRYDEVKGVLGRIPVGAALKIFKQFEPKSTTITKPTSWIYKAAEGQLGSQESWGNEGGDWQGGRSAGWGGGGGGGGGDSNNKVRKTISWYNKHGGLQQPIKFEDCAGYLDQLDAKDAMQMLKTLGAKSSTINNPTAWICGWAKKHLGSM